MLKKIFLVEIGTEELPAQILYNLICAFLKNFKNELNTYNILYKKINYFATPRRLALKVIDIDTSEKIKKILKKGPSVKNSFNKDGKPTSILNHWIKQYNIDIDKTHRIKTSKGEWIGYLIEEKQEKIESLIPKIIEKSLKKITHNHFMKWNSSQTKFCRPIRNIVTLLDSHLIEQKIFNIIPKNILHNHISSKNKKIYIYKAKDYPEILFRENKIIADYQQRKEKIIKEAEKIAKKVKGFINKNITLIEEITSLVESPKILLGKFCQRYIKDIPQEILSYTIEKKQKCFPIYNSEKKILPYFIFIANIHPKNIKEIIYGNEKVINSRLSDTVFFFKKDRKTKLENRLISLKKVLFHKNLGTLYDKTMRLKLLTEWTSSYVTINKNNLIRASLLSKCDLITDMVSEFPELQGIIGMHYALQDKENKEVCEAIKEQYLPSFSGDQLPSSLIGCILSIANKIDTLSGMFYINQIPSSEKDPFGLRRATLGIIRIIILKKIPLNIKDLIFKSLNIYDKNKNNFLQLNKIENFFIGRLLFFYESQGYNSLIIQSVLSSGLSDLLNIDKKIKAISNFQKTDRYESIILIIKRISNILKKNNNEKLKKDQFNIDLIQGKEEKKLFQEIEKFNKQTKKLFLQKKYIKILLKIIILEKPINNFFNTTTINHKCCNIRKNRLILLMTLKKIFSKITDFSFLY